MSVSTGLILLAGAFLFVHLLTDARRMIQVLRLRHYPGAIKGACDHCTNVKTGIKEAWWEVATFVALVGHLIMDYAG